MSGCAACIPFRIDSRSEVPSHPTYQTMGTKAKVSNRQSICAFGPHQRRPLHCVQTDPKTVKCLVTHVQGSGQKSIVNRHDSHTVYSNSAEPLCEISTQASGGLLMLFTGILVSKSGVPRVSLACFPAHACPVSGNFSYSHTSFQGFLEPDTKPKVSQHNACGAWEGLRAITAAVCFLFVKLSQPLLNFCGCRLLPANSPSRSALLLWILSL